MKKFKFDLMLFDFRMFRMDVIETLRALSYLFVSEDRCLKAITGPRVKI